MRNLRFLETLLLCLCLCVGASAEATYVDTVDVPVDKLVANLEKRVSASPKDSHLHYLLGRVHAIAYARNATALQVERKTQDPFFGQFDPGFPPPEVSAASDPAQRERARKHLEKAIAEYARAVELDAKNLSAHLGWAWCLDQAGRKQEALKQYRAVWSASEGQVPAGALFNDTLGQETGRYMLRLLDPRKDAAEIARVKKRVDELARLPRAITPVVIPLDPLTPFEQLVDESAAVPFDLDGSGERLEWGWITPRAGWLVYRDHRPGIHSGLQLIGSVTFWAFWRDGYEALDALDDDGDGWLSGQEFDHLYLWNDDGDGVSRPEELLTLESLGIVGLSTRSCSHPHGFPFNPAGVRYGDGRSGPSFDWCPATPGRR